jgi:hypothetical protein
MLAQLDFTKPRLLFSLTTNPSFSFSIAMVVSAMGEQIKNYITTSFGKQDVPPAGRLTEFIPVKVNPIVA